MATISGSHGNDKINGTSNDDVLKGNGGNDVIKGGNGDDTIYGGTGNDKLHGNNGGDILQGGFGNDKLYGDNEGDILQGGLGYDKLYGGAGNDTFNIFDELSLCDFHSGGDGNDFFFFDQNIPLGGWDESDEQVGITKKYGIKSEGEANYEGGIHIDKLCSFSVSCESPVDCWI